MKVINEQEFNELMGSNKTVLVDFFATWCGPCKMIAPVLEQLEDIDVIKVDVDEERELAVKFGIQAVPTLILIKDKQEIARTQGYHDLEDLKNWINQYK